MITVGNFKYLLVALGFSKSRSGYSKTIGDTLLAVDVAKQVIKYPETEGLKVNNRTTCNFDHAENFVVFECVHRLLEKGYRPEHLELEPTWKVGRGASGGRADILVKDHFGKPLLLIECKTPGAEFSKAWKKTLQDGDQLFSYAQQISETQFLCLYASDFSGGELDFISHVISHRDNEEYLADNPLFKSFVDASDVKERYAVWKDTYKLDYTTKGIFEDNIQPYQIGKDKYTIDDLKAIAASDQQKKYHQFATILRQHNVSGRENAFDKLVNLFLCKLVDEIENPEELKFYWKGVAYDSHFDLIDRLQQLYQAGMGKFLDEDITYINQDDVNGALKFIRQNPDATQRTVWNLFRQQKFFTNNDFSFLDVHNESLFYQNADVLLKIIQMWQDIRLTNPDGHNQFLGDMFEGFLDQGVKQSEGQFFTPMPICRFILMSLPLESMVQNSAVPPMAIDYACGAGHFLNELALQLKPLVEKHKQKPDMDDYHRCMVGIEKEYRLSKVAKVSAFMYGQQGIQICYGDGLVSQHERFPDIKDGHFDLLVANPPYSVKGFLETLEEEERENYSLTDTVGDASTGNSIETFFIERAKQLLKGGGVAAVILPSSILSNGGGSYIRTREILLQYFDIVAIAEFGSGTFGKTGTNTVTLFLRRKKTSPEPCDHYRGRISEWFAEDENQPVYQDAHLIDQYCAHVGIPVDDYKTLMSGEADGAWKQRDHFKPYADKFSKSTELKNLKKTKRFKELDKDKQKAEIAKRYLAYVQTLEKDKLFHFVMASDQPNPVLIIRSPTATKEIKKFLGYEWSTSKGDEGIKLKVDAEGRHLTALYDAPATNNPAGYNRDHPEKLNQLIASNFDGKLGAIPEELTDVAKTARLADMLDFSRAEFEKQFSLVPSLKTEVFSKWETTPLNGLVAINPESADPVEIFGDHEFEYIDIASVENGTGKVLFSNLVNPKEAPSRARRRVNVEDILLSTVRPNLKAFAYLEELPKRVLASTGFAVLRADKQKIAPRFLCELLFCDVLQNQMMAKMGKGQYPSINRADIESLIIPVPPSEVQNQIVTELELEVSRGVNARKNIAKSKNELKRMVAAVYTSKAPRVEVEELSTNIQYGLNEKMNEAGIGYRCFRMNEIAEGRMVDNGEMKCADISAEEFEKYRLNKGDLLFNRTNSIEHVGKTGLFDLDGDYCFASYLVRVVPDQKKVLPLFLCKMMNSPAYQQEAKGKASRAVNQSNINATVMKNIKVPVPTMARQKTFVKKVQELEQKIADAQGIIDAAPAKKEAIMKKYL